MSTNSFVPAPIAQLPWHFIGLILALGSFGAVVLYSAAGNGGSFSPWAGSHIVRLCVFLGGAILLARLKESFWKEMAFPAYAIILLMLFGVEILGKISGGSQRWLDLGIIRLQPSELMKPKIGRAHV